MICETCGQIVIKHTKQQDVIDAVLTYFDVDFHYLKTRSRKRQVVYPRQVMMYLLRKDTSLTLKNVGSLFKLSEEGKPWDHTSVIHSCQTINDLLDTDEATRNDIYLIEKMIK